MNTTDLEQRPLWVKLLDPMREHYPPGIVSDEALLRRIVGDLQRYMSHNEQLMRTVRDQADILRRHGWGGY